MAYSSDILGDTLPQAIHAHFKRRVTEYDCDPDSIGFSTTGPSPFIETNAKFMVFCKKCKVYETTDLLMLDLPCIDKMDRLVVEFCKKHTHELEKSGRKFRE